MRLGTILATAGAGFIDSGAVAALLDRGNGVVCLDDLNDYDDPALKQANLEPARDNPRFRLVEGATCDVALVEDTHRRFGVTTTVHRAARADVRP